MEDFEYSLNEQNKLFESIYLGYTKLSNPPKKLYLSTAKVLENALYKGYKKTLQEVDFGTPDYKLLSELRENIYIFSGAKTATQVDQIKDLMYDGDRVVGLEEFKKKAKAKFDTYNGKNSYLETEYVTAQTTASSARGYKDALEDKELFPYLQAHVIMDDVTAPECERMNGVIAKVDDPIWNHNLAARHFNCRCFETKLDKYDNAKVTPKAKRERIMRDNDKDMDKLFKFNPVKEKIIFSDEHPYYDIGKRNKELAKKNYGLPIPKK